MGDCGDCGSCDCGSCDCGSCDCSCNECITSSGMCCTGACDSCRSSENSYLLWYIILCTGPNSDPCCNCCGFGRANRFVRYQNSKGSYYPQQPGMQMQPHYPQQPGTQMQPYYPQQPGTHMQPYYPQQPGTHMQQMPIRQSAGGARQIQSVRLYEAPRAQHHP